MVMSLIESLTKIKNAVYGREVREAIHDGVFRANQIANEALEAQAYDGNSLADVTLAKDGLPTLDARIKRDINNLENKKADKAETTAQLAQKANDSDVRKRSESIGLNDVSSELLLAIEGGEGTEFILETIPRDNSVSPIKTTFFNESKNLFNPETVILNKTLNTDGQYIDSSYLWVNIQKIPVTQGDILHISPVHADNAIWTFDSNDVRLSTAYSSSYTVTSKSIAYVKIVSSIDHTTTMVNKGETALPFQIYGDRLKMQHIPSEISVKMSSLEENVEVLRGVQESHGYQYVERIEYEIGTIASTGENGADQNAFRNKTNVDLLTGDSLHVSNGFRIFVVVFKQGGQKLYHQWMESGATLTADQNISIRFMVRTALNQLPEAVSDFVVVNKIVKYATQEDIAGINNEERVRFVSVSGNDSSKGDSVNEPYATLQKAMDDKASTVYIERGDYYNSSVSVSGKMDKLTILPYGDDSTQKIRFIGGEKVEGWQPDGNIFRTSLSEGVNFSAVFINKTLPTMTTASRPAPNAVLWESKDFELDYMMTPVLTLSECQSLQGSFYWDGTYLYINPLNVANDFWLPNIQNGLNFQGVEHLIGQDVVADYYINQPLTLERIKKLDIIGWEAHHSAKTDGFSLDYSYGDLKNCKAYKNRNDGYNNHYDGHVNLYNCEGVNNFDDGASPHENCSMTVYGGIYRGNGKGGIIPAAGATARVYNALLKDNRIGFNNATETSGSISSGNLYIGNEVGIQNERTNGFISINDKLIDNGVESVGAYEKY